MLRSITPRTDFSPKHQQHQNSPNNNFVKTSSGCHPLISPSSSLSASRRGSAGGLNNNHKNNVITTSASLTGTGTMSSSTSSSSSNLSLTSPLRNSYSPVVVESLKSPLPAPSLSMSHIVNNNGVVGVTPSSSRQNHYHLPPHPFASHNQHVMKQQVSSTSVQLPPTNTSSPQQITNQQQQNANSNIYQVPQVVQTTIVKSQLVQPMMCGHKMISVMNSIPAFLTSSSSTSTTSSNSSNSITHSSPPSMPTTPDSHSSEQLSCSVSKSQPDLSKLEELEFYLSHNLNLNHHHSQHHPQEEISAGHLNYINPHHNVNNNIGYVSNDNFIDVNNTGNVYNLHQNINATSNHSTAATNEETIYSNSSIFRQYQSNSSVNSPPRSTSGSLTNPLSSLSRFETSYNNNQFNYDNNHVVNVNSMLPPPSPLKSTSIVTTRPPTSNSFVVNNYQQESQQPLQTEQQQKSSYHDHEYQNRQNLMEELINENRQLKTELEFVKSINSSLEQRIVSLEKIEVDIQKVVRAHEELMKSAEKKEKFEQALRYKLENELRRLQTENEELRTRKRSTMCNQRTASYDSSNIVMTGQRSNNHCFKFPLD